MPSRLPGRTGPSDVVNVTLPNNCLLVFSFFVYLFSAFSRRSALLLQWGRWPVAHPVLRGPAVPVSPVGVWMCCVGRVHSWRVSHPNRKKISFRSFFVFFFFPFPSAAEVFPPSAALGATVTCSFHVGHDAAVEACVKQSSVTQKTKLYETLKMDSGLFDRLYLCFTNQSLAKRLPVFLLSSKHHWSLEHEGRRSVWSRLFLEERWFEIVHRLLLFFFIS